MWRPGIIYIIQRTDGLYKIGLTKKLSKRLKELRRKFPFCLIHIIEADDIYKAERFLHYQFKDYRIEGEWFDLPLTHLNDLQKIKHIPLTNEQLIVKVINGQLVTDNLLTPSQNFTLQRAKLLASPKNGSRWAEARKVLEDAGFEVFNI